MVFKKLTDLTSRATNTLIHGNETAGKIHQLESMGFDAQRAKHALNATGGNVERAAELLLLGGGNDNDVVMHDATTAHRAAASNNQQSTQYTAAAEGTHVRAHNNDQMKRAIQESLDVNQFEQTKQVKDAEMISFRDMEKKKAMNKKKEKTEVIDLISDDEGEDKKPSSKKKKENKVHAATTQKKQPKSAAAINAGKAATSRFNNNNTTTKTPFNTNVNNQKTKTTLDHTHPNLKIPTKMSNKSKEEQIMRCANRVKSHVMAVDTLLRVLTSVKTHPDNPKFRVIDRTNVNYVKYVRDAPGAEDLLHAMNYHSMLPGANKLRLERHRVDDILLYLGISSLEQMKLTNEYIENKKQLAFHKEMARIGKMNGSIMSSMSEYETNVRLEYMSKCPTEPPIGRGAIMSIYLGNENEKIQGGYVTRRFDGDDILNDVLNWLGGCYGNEILDKMGRNGGNNAKREWCFCDLNRYPMLPLDIEKHGRKTLQFLGLFPSGKLGVRLSSDAWRDRKEDALEFDIHGSARGLGAASRSMLH